MRPAPDCSRLARISGKPEGLGKKNVRLPTWIKAACRADGKPLEGAMLQVTIKVRRKNDFTVPFGPTDESGGALIHLRAIQDWAEIERALFPMDFTGLGDATGEFAIAAMNRESVRGALAAYEMFHQGVRYPSGYSEDLRDAQRALNRIAPATLSVEVEHDGEGVIVRTPEVAA